VGGSPRISERQNKSVRFGSLLTRFNEPIISDDYDKVLKKAKKAVETTTGLSSSADESGPDDATGGFKHCRTG
jgi:hypothetical protein